MTTPAVSVILVTYNHAPFVEQAVTSVLDQRGVDLEIILSEDRSTDGTREIVQRIAEEHPEIRLLLSEENRNDFEVYRRALLTARGRYVAYLDGDDYWLPGKLARQVAFMDANDHLAMSFHATRVIGHPTDERYGYARPSMDFADLYRKGCVMASLTVMYRRSCIPLLPAWLDHAPVGDWPTHLLVAEQGPIGYFDAELAVYRVHAGGLWTGASRRQQLGWELEILRMMRRRAGPRHRRHAQAAIPSRYDELAKVAHAEGRRLEAVGAACRAIGSSLLVGPRSLARSCKRMLSVVLPNTLVRLARRRQPVQ